jgi:hypothetical protein
LENDVAPEKCCVACTFSKPTDRRRGELVELLTAPVLPATAAVAFKDSGLLGRTNDGTPAYLVFCGEGLMLHPALPLSRGATLHRTEAGCGRI